VSVHELGTSGGEPVDTGESPAQVADAGPLPAAPEAPEPSPPEMAEERREGRAQKGGASASSADVGEVAGRAEPRAASRASRVGMATDAPVLPGDLRSGGAQDDGGAVRAAAAFRLPRLDLLDDHPAIVAGTDEAALLEVSRRLSQTLREFKIEGRVSAIRPGPVITMYEFEPAPGVKLSTIVGLQDNIKMALRAVSVRIVAPLPGRGCVGIEVPNDKRQTIWARDVFASGEFSATERILPMILGKDTEGRPYVTDLAKMPHLLIGGTTGSGKSVGVNAMLCSMLYVRSPDELRMILIDPKMLEFSLYEDIPHLLHPVVTDAKLASSVLKWACDEMDERYRLMARWQTRNIEGFNQKVERELAEWTPEKARFYAPKDWPEGDLLPQPKKLPYVVIVIDELADLMLVASSDVETSISRIVAKARAAGLHLIVATQTPRRDVVTGTIKANMPASLAYMVKTPLDSRIILDEMGAETLLGRGDLLFRAPGTSNTVRIHGPFLSEGEVQRIADHLRGQGTPQYDARIANAARSDASEDEEVEYDEKYDEAVNFAIERGSISTSMLQRHLGIGYNRAANIVDVMEREGVVGPADGVKPRKILVGGNH
jgi:S-DNA-T family DNA segregation ATPase FtsK/SpoIIIE